MKITISIAPTFLNPEDDIYHKASVGIEFDPDEVSVGKAQKKLIQLYREALEIEKEMVKSERSANAGRTVGKILKDIKKKVKAELKGNRDDAR